MPNKLIELTLRIDGDLDDWPAGETLPMYEDVPSVSFIVARGRPEADFDDVCAPDAAL